MEATQRIYTGRREDDVLNPTVQRRASRNGYTGSRTARGQFMKLTVRMGALVGFALTLLIAGCGERTGTNEQTVIERQSEERQPQKQ
jgi:hypothetical protein